MAMAVNQDSYREIIGAVEGMKEDKASWLSFLRHLKQRGLNGVRLIISDKCPDLVEALGEVYPQISWQRCMVHFYRNVFSKTPRGKLADMAAMLKAIHAQEDKAAAQQKAEQVVVKLREMRLNKAADSVANGIDETLSYYAFPREHQKHLRTNNPLERIMKEIRQRTRVVGSFPDANSVLMLVVPGCVISTSANGARNGI